MSVTATRTTYSPLCVLVIAAQTYLSLHLCTGDGDIDFDEFLKLLVESDVASAARFAVVFKTLDTDGDGSVSAAELRAALEKRGLGVTDDQLQAMLKAADTDGNGQLSFEGKSGQWVCC